MRNAWVHLNLDHPMAAWHAYRGVIKTPHRVKRELLSPWLVDFLHASTRQLREQRFQRELLLEKTRARVSPDANSRLTSFFAFDDYDIAIDRARAWGWRAENLVEIRIQNGSTLSRHDSQWIDEMGASPAIQQAESYARGDAFNSTPKWELLVDGEARIVGTAVRLRALHEIESRWPQSLWLLEQARIAALLGNDLGYVGGFAHLVDNDLIRIRWITVAEALKDPGYAARVEQFFKDTPPTEILGRAFRRDGQPNDIVLPDWSPIDFDVPASIWTSLFGPPRNSRS